MDDSIYYAKYCKICGKQLTEEKDREKGKHAECGKSNYCCYCGKSLKGIHWWNFNTHYATCSNECIQNNTNENIEINRIPFKTKYPLFNNNIIDWIIKFDEQGAEDDDDYDDNEIQSRNSLYKALNSDNYVVLFEDSDGRVWFEKLESDVSMDVVKYIVKSRHRHTIGMGCNEYVNSIVKSKQPIDITNLTN